ncbi:hypothetical protein TIFTF001_014331 [Ficus carica]|uniref:Uncharacterized protein n=1 Tax=Ficus carica TaxID=3494 RepID=A0AA88AR57_FICCA|nr:hypothetical protein TIFTF001_014331 [Ficus carica]
MNNLEDMFGDQTIQAKTDAIKGLMNCRQKASYNLNRKEMSLTELMKELQAFENIFKVSGSKAEANVVEPSSPAPNPKRKKEKGKNCHAPTYVGLLPCLLNLNLELKYLSLLKISE